MKNMIKLFLSTFAGIVVSASAYAGTCTANGYSINQCLSSFEYFKLSGFYQDQNGNGQPCILDSNGQSGSSAHLFCGIFNIPKAQSSRHDTEWYPAKLIFRIFAGVEDWKEILRKNNGTYPSGTPFLIVPHISERQGHPDDALTVSWNGSQLKIVADGSSPVVALWTISTTQLKGASTAETVNIDLAYTCASYDFTKRKCLVKVDTTYAGYRMTIPSDANSIDMYAVKPTPTQPKYLSAAQNIDLTTAYGRISPTTINELFGLSGPYAVKYCNALPTSPITDCLGHITDPNFQFDSQYVAFSLDVDEGKSASIRHSVHLSPDSGLWTIGFSEDDPSALFNVGIFNTNQFLGGPVVPSRKVTREHKLYNGDDVALVPVFPPAAAAADARLKKELMNSLAYYGPYLAMKFHNATGNVTLHQYHAYKSFDFDPMCWNTSTGALDICQSGQTATQFVFRYVRGMFAVPPWRQAQTN